MPKSFPRVTIIFILLSTCKAKLEEYWCSEIKTKDQHSPTWSQAIMLIYNRVWLKLPENLQDWSCRIIQNSAKSNRGFARQPCCMAETIDSILWGKMFFPMQDIFIVPAMQNLYTWGYKPGNGAIWVVDFSYWLSELSHERNAMNSSVKSIGRRKMAVFLLLKSLAVGKCRRTWVQTQLCLHKAWCKHVTCSACSIYVTSIVPCLHNLIQSPTSFVLIILILCLNLAWWSSLSGNIFLP